MIVVIDGPNKAGKTTLVESVRDSLLSLGYNAKIRHWGPIDPDDRVYSPALISDSKDRDTVTIWDRSWVSEHVYGQLLKRENRRLTNDPWLGEFLHRRALIGNGAGFILIPRTVALGKQRLDKSDEEFSADYEHERGLFLDYAVRFKWHGILNDYTKESLKKNTAAIVATVTSKLPKYDPVHMIVSTEKFVFVGSKHVDDVEDQNWLPFSSPRLVSFARLFGDYALVASWADPEYVTPAILKAFNGAVCVGQRAYDTISALNTSVSKMLFYIPTYGGQYTIEQAQSELANMVHTERVIALTRILKGAWNETPYI
jgi:hypothetical protein